MLDRGLLASLLLLGGMSASRAEFTVQRRDRAGEWHAAQWRDMAAPTRPRRCVFYNEAANGALRLVIGYTQGANINTLPEIGFGLTNPAWQIPEGTRGPVTLQSGPVTRSFEFYRTAPTVMDVVPPREEANGALLNRIADGNPVTLTLPGNRRETIPGGNPEFSALVLACLITLAAFDPPASTNPFAGTAPAPSTNPFAGTAPAPSTNPFGSPAPLPPQPNARARDPFTTAR